MPDACPLGCGGALSAPRVTCVETTSRQCGRCGCACTRRDDCSHVAEIARLRSAAEINAGMWALDRAELAAEIARLRGALGTLAQGEHDTRWDARALALVCLPGCRACHAARALLDDDAPAERSTTP